MLTENKLSTADAIQIACNNAKQKQESYYREPFQPHDWVVEAIKEAYLYGWNAKKFEE